MKTLTDSIVEELKSNGWRTDEDPIAHILPVNYWGEIADDVVKVLSLIHAHRGMWYEHIAGELELDKKYVHLILEIAADADLTEYGTSPRVSWLTDRGEVVLALCSQHRAARNTAPARAGT